MLKDAAAAAELSGKMKVRLGYMVAAVLALLLPSAAIGLYLKLGSPQVLEGTTIPPVQPSMAIGRAGQMEETVGKFVERLTDQLKRVPDDGESWVMLSRSYVVLRQYPEAVKAFQRATQLVENDATLLADYADALAMAQGRSLEGKPEELIQQALSVDPNNDKALYLAGTASYNRKDYKSAIKQWEKLYALLPSGSASTREIMLSILDAKARSGDKAAAIQLQSAFNLKTAIHH